MTSPEALQRSIGFRDDFDGLGHVERNRLVRVFVALELTVGDRGDA